MALIKILFLSATTIFLWISSLFYIESYSAVAEVNSNERNRFIDMLVNGGEFEKYDYKSEMELFSNKELWSLYANVRRISGYGFFNGVYDYCEEVPKEFNFIRNYITKRILGVVFEPMFNPSGALNRFGQTMATVGTFDALESYLSSRDQDYILFLIKIVGLNNLRDVTENDGKNFAESSGCQNPVTWIAAENALRVAHGATPMSLEVWRDVNSLRPFGHERRAYSREVLGAYQPVFFLNTDQEIMYEDAYARVLKQNGGKNFDVLVCKWISESGSTLNTFSEVPALDPNIIKNLLDRHKGIFVGSNNNSLFPRGCPTSYFRNNSDIAAYLVGTSIIGDIIQQQRR